MNERRDRLTARNKMVAYIAAGIVHAVIIGALVFNFSSRPESIETDFAEKVDVVKATTVDESEIKRKQDEIKRQEREKQRKKQADRDRLKRERERELKKIEDLKKQQLQEKIKAEELQQQRKEIALKKKQEEEQRKLEAQERLQQRLREEEARKKREADLAKKRQQEKLRQQELDRIVREEQELQAMREMKERLAREEALIAKQRAEQRATTLASKYGALIKQRVRPKITISPDFSPTLSTRMNVKLSPSGGVQSVRVIESSGNRAYDRAVETAIYASSPLPIPSREEDPDVNSMFQDLTLNFSIDGR